jgi:dihydroorotase
MSLLLKNALVVDLQSPYHNKKKDIFIKNGRIESFGKSAAKEVIDCKGKIVTPGWFDLNANFRDPGFEFKEDIASGSQTASNGGFTDVCLMPDNNPPVVSKSDVKYIKSKEIPGVDLHVSAAVSKNLDGDNLTEMIDLKKSGSVFFSEGDQAIWNTKLLLSALQYSSSIGARVFQNARDFHLSANSQMHEGLTSTGLGLKGEPSLSEELIIARDISILRYTGGKIHFSKISSSKSLDLIKKAKKEKLDVTCDVSIHHLLFNDTFVKDFDTTFKSLPPFRSETDRKALIKGITEGTIDAICSDHRPQDLESKKLEFDLADPGAISLQTFFPALKKITGIPFDILVDKITHGPRRILGMGEVKISKGSLAKITILDLDQKWVFNQSSNLSKSKNSPFWGKEMEGKVIATINGETVSIFN